MAKKATIVDVSAGYNSNATLNNNFEAINNQFDNTLSLDGSTPNAMQADFDMNGNDILNAGAVYVGGQDVISVMQTIYDNYVNFATNVTVSTASPTGGNDGDLWFKVSS